MAAPGPDYSVLFVSLRQFKWPNPPVSGFVFTHNPAIRSATGASAGRPFSGRSR